MNIWSFVISNKKNMENIFFTLLKVDNESSWLCFLLFSVIIIFFSRELHNQSNVNLTSFYQWRIIFHRIP